MGRQILQQYYTASGASARSWDKDAAATLYARWAKASAKVSFDPNGGSGGQSAAVTAAYGKAMPSISATKPARSGYEFGGWYDTASASGGTQYYTSSCASARSWDKPGEAILYARWLPIVTFDQKGGTGGTSSKAVASGSTVGTVTPTTSGPAPTCS